MSVFPGLSLSVLFEMITLLPSFVSATFPSSAFSWIISLRSKKVGAGNIDVEETREKRANIKNTNLAFIFQIIIF